VLQIVQNYRTGTLEVVDVPSPGRRPGSLVVRTETSVVSTGTERQLVELARKSLFGKALARPDLVRQVLDKIKTDGLTETIQHVRRRLETVVPLGYSAAGAVIEVGEGVSGFAVGDWVACGGPGVATHAEILSVPATLAVRVPPSLLREHAAFAMVGAIPLHAARQCHTTQGDWVAVIGLGLLGLLAVQIFRAGGARVVGLDVVHDKLTLARDLGAEIVCDAAASDAAAAVIAATGGHGVDRVLIAASASGNAPLELAARITRVGGRIVAMGLVGLDVPRDLFFERELELVVSRASGPGLFDPRDEVNEDYPYPYVRWTHARNMAEFLRLVESGAVRLGPLITHRFPIDRAPEAYAVLRGEAREQCIGIVLQYPDNRRERATKVAIPTNRRVPDRALLGIGLIGAGLFARTTLLPELRRIDCVELVGVTTASGVTAHAVARDFGFRYAASDPAQILDDPDIDCVMIATRHDSHCRLTVAALRAGKDVFVEKPLALTLAELREIVAAARGGGRIMVGFNRRHSPHALALRQYLAGATGPQVVHCRVNAGNIAPGSWVNDPVAGGDRIRGEVCHFVDLAHYIVGQSAVAVEASTLPPTRIGSPIEDVVTSLLFEDGSVANIVYTARGHRTLPRERVEGFRGGRASVVDNFRVTRFYGVRAPHPRRTWRLDRGYRDELQTWFKALRDGRPSPVSLEEYVASTVVTLTVADAVKRPGRVPVDWGDLELIS
jgi:predicted dehydrogenase/threonine dehydrogenase-like Zn-dependent dehydrogenase